MMRICHVTNGRYPEAGRSTVFEYSKAEAKLGLDVSVIALAKECSGYSPAIGNEEVQLYTVQFCDLGSPVRNYFHFSWRAHRILRNLEFDIVHIYDDLGMAAPILPLGSGRRRKRTVWIRNFRSAPISPGLAARISRYVLRMQTGFFDATLAQSEGTREQIFGRDCEDIFIARQGANLNLFQKTVEDELRSELALDEPTTLIVFSGALDPARRLNTLLHAMSLVNQSESNVVLLILGDGPDRERLTALSQHLSLGDSVIFHGKVDYAQVPRFLSAADIGLAYVPNTAELGPQPPLKTVEMLACELPVVASNTRGNRHFIQHGYNGLLAKDNAGDIAQSILKLVNDDQLRTTLSKVARDSVAKYDYATIVKNSIVPHYYQLLERHNHPQGRIHSL